MDENSSEPPIATPKAAPTAVRADGAIVAPRPMEPTPRADVKQLGWIVADIVVIGVPHYHPVLSVLSLVVASELDKWREVDGMRKDNIWAGI